MEGTRILEIAQLDCLYKQANAKESSVFDIIFDQFNITSKLIFPFPQSPHVIFCMFPSMNRSYFGSWNVLSCSTSMFLFSCNEDDFFDRSGVGRFIICISPIEVWPPYHWWTSVNSMSLGIGKSWFPSVNWFKGLGSWFWNHLQHRLPNRLQASSTFPSVSLKERHLKIRRLFQSPWKTKDGLREVKKRVSSGIHRPKSFDA